MPNVRCAAPISVQQKQGRKPRVTISGGVKALMLVLMCGFEVGVLRRLICGSLDGFGCDWCRSCTGLGGGRDLDEDVEWGKRGTGRNGFRRR